MLIGSKDQLAVESNIEIVSGSWIYGDFLLWIGGSRIGDPMDPSVHLKACFSWMRDVMLKPENRYEPGLFAHCADEAYTVLARSVFASEDPAHQAEPVYENTYSRFHISHIGMSSFDDVRLLLVTDEFGNERLIWQTGDDPVKDFKLAAGEVERVFSLAVEAFENKVRSLEPGDFGGSV